jgi:hypothetical protein
MLLAADLQGGSAEELTMVDAVFPVALSTIELVLAWWAKEREEGGRLG